MRLSLVLQVLPLREEGRSAFSEEEVLPGFFVDLIAVTFTTGPLMTLVMTVFLSSWRAGLRFPRGGPRGLADVVAP